MSDNRPIGVFDSGVGGTSVLKELVQLMPCENFIYYGDSAHAPYGNRPFNEVEALTCATAEYLLSKNVKALVIACNTATAAAARTLREAHPELPIIGIEPALKPAVEHSPGQIVVVMATNVTLAEPKFHALMEAHIKEADIRTIGCPEIVTHVEEGDTTSAELKAYIRSRLQFALKEGENISDISSVVLGCTHYPFVRPLLEEILSPDCFLIDGGGGTARETLRQLKAHGLEACGTDPGQVIFENSDSGKIALARKLFANP